jgi:ABC-type nitrate/sulfonate/bicarbonate transport system substrate-binding protein
LPTAFGIAARRGWLEDELAPDGVDVRSVTSSADPAVRESHFTQTLPAFFRHGGNIPPLVARSRGRDVRLIGLSWAPISLAVLALPGSGIESAADLRGRRVSLPRHVNDPVDFWRPTVIRGFEMALASAGLEPGDVEWVDVTVDRTFVQGATADTGRRDPLWGVRSMLGHGREEVLALLRGDVDAIFTEGTFVTNVSAFTGARVVIDLAALPDPGLRINNAAPAALTVTGDLLDARPDLVARVLARVLRAADWARANPADAARDIAADSGAAEGVVAAAYAPDVADHLGVDLSDDRIAAIASQAGLLHRHGLIDAPVDIDAFVAREPLEEARRLLDADRLAVAP